MDAKFVKNYYFQKIVFDAEVEKKYEELNKIWIFMKYIKVDKNKCQIW